MGLFLALVGQLLEFLFATRVDPIAAAADRLPPQDLEKGPLRIMRQAKLVREQLVLLLQQSGDYEQRVPATYEASKQLLRDLWGLLAD